MFASTELAARIEAAEADLIRAGAESAAAPALALPLAGGLAVHTVEGSPLNKVVGLGFAGPLDQAELEAVERELAARGAGAVQVELSTLAEPSIAGLLTAGGYRLVGFENVLARPLPVDMVQPAGIDIAPGSEADLELWTDLVVTGFARPDTQGVASHEAFPRALLEGVMREMAAIPGYARFLAHRAGSPAGGASMRLHGGVALLTGAATLPEHRRRGVQTALLAHRLAEAAARGCDVAVMTTQPGSKSAENGHKLGFALLYPRAVLVRELG